MTANEAKSEVKRIFPGEQIELEKRNGTCLVLRAPKPDDKSEINRLKDGRVVLGGGPSWKAALRVAAKPVVLRLQAEELQARRDIQIERNEFEDFLRERLMGEFEQWKAARAAPVPEPEPGPVGSAPPAGTGTPAAPEVGAGG